MEPHLAQLLQSNEAPSQRMVSEITQILQEPSNQFRANQLEIQRLKQAIHALNVDQERIRDFVKPYHTILAPIRRLPADVLHEIFFHCLPSHRLPIMDASEPPLLLTHICSSWRTIALSSPRLWAQLIISLPSQPIPHSQEKLGPPLATQKYERIAALRSDAIKIWLDRSGDCPLSLSITSVANIYGRWDEWTARILDNIVLYTDRWQLIELAVPYFLYVKFEESISNAALSSLKAFKLKIEVPSTNGRRFAEGPPKPPSLLVLQTLKLDTFSLLWPKYTNDFNTIPMMWHRLRHLFLHSPIPNTYMIPLLSECPNIVECRLWIDSDEDDDEQAVVSEPLRTVTVSLPHLQYFLIHDTSISLATASAYKSIHAPTLRTVGYTRSYQGSVDLHGSVTECLKYQLSSFGDLLEAAPVDNFMLALAYQSSQTVLDILKRVPRPRHVIIGQKLLPFRLAESTGSPRYLDTLYPQTLPELNRFSLSNLVITDVSTSTDDVLLPNLEVLEVYGISNSSDDDAVNMFKSRLLASKSGRISGLKAVTLHFNRPMERDIEKEIYHYANEVGASPIKLELVYRKVDKRPAHMIPQSSSFGLSQAEGITWAAAMEYEEFK